MRSGERWARACRQGPGARPLHSARLLEFARALCRRPSGWSGGLGLGPGDPSGGAVTFPHGPSAQCTRAASVFNRLPSAVRSRTPWPEDSRVSRRAGGVAVPVNASAASKASSSPGLGPAGPTKLRPPGALSSREAMVAWVAVGRMGCLVPGWAGTRPPRRGSPGISCGAL